MLTREQLLKYIYNAMLTNSLVTSNEVDGILQMAYGKRCNSNVRYIFEHRLPGTVRIDDFFLRKEGEDIVLVFCMPSYESLDLGDCIDIIGSYAFLGNYIIKNIRGESVKQIQDWAFSDCQFLNIVEFPRVDIIETRCFKDCFKLCKVKISPVELEAQAFSNCYKLKSFDFSKTTYIGTRAFAYTNISSINAPMLYHIGWYAFLGTKVKKLIAPNLTSLHDTAFAGCTLELICTPEDIKQQIIVNQESYE